jgi:hypothetical protein
MVLDVATNLSKGIFDTFVSGVSSSLYQAVRGGAQYSVGSQRSQALAAMVTRWAETSRQALKASRDINETPSLDDKEGPALPSVRKCLDTPPTPSMSSLGKEIGMLVDSIVDGEAILSTLNSDAKEMSLTKALLLTRCTIRPKSQTRCSWDITRMSFRSRSVLPGKDMDLDFVKTHIQTRRALRIIYHVIHCRFAVMKETLPHLRTLRKSIQVSTNGTRPVSKSPCAKRSSSSFAMPAMVSSSIAALRRVLQNALECEQKGFALARAHILRLNRLRETSERASIVASVSSVSRDAGMTTLELWSSGIETLSGYMGAAPLRRIEEWDGIDHLSRTKSSTSSSSVSGSDVADTATSPESDSAKLDSGNTESPYAFRGAREDDVLDGAGGGGSGGCAGEGEGTIESKTEVCDGRGRLLGDDDMFVFRRSSSQSSIDTARLSATTDVSEQIHQSIVKITSRMNERMDAMQREVDRRQGNFRAMEFTKNQMSRLIRKRDGDDPFIKDNASVYIYCIMKTRREFTKLLGILLDMTQTLQSVCVPVP